MRSRSRWFDSLQGQTGRSVVGFLSGLAILFVAQVISAFMGLYIEATYAMYGNNYREGMFYTVCCTAYFNNSYKLNISSMLCPYHFSDYFLDLFNYSSVGTWILNLCDQRCAFRLRSTMSSHGYQDMYCSWCSTRSRNISASRAWIYWDQYVPHWQ